MPFRARRRHVRPTEYLGHAAAAQPRERRCVGERQRDDRQYVAPSGVVPAGGKPAEADREDQHQERCHDDRRQRQSQCGGCYQHPVSRPVARHGRERAAGDADDHRECERQAADGDADWQASRDQLVDGEVLVPERRPQVAASEHADVSRVLMEDRLVQVIGGAQVRLNFWRQAALAIERPARGCPGQEEGHRDDGEQGDEGERQPAKNVASHLKLPAEQPASTAPRGRRGSVPGARCGEWDASP